MLVEAVRVKGAGCWEKVAALVPGRTASQCNARYLHYLQPGINLGPFSPEEDLVIINGCLEVGPQWVKIAAHLPGRTGHAVKNRWQTLNNKIFGPKEESKRIKLSHPTPPARKVFGPIDSHFFPWTSVEAEGSFSSGITSTSSPQHMRKRSSFDSSSDGVCTSCVLRLPVELDADELLTFDFLDPTNSPLLVDENLNGW